MDVLHYIADNGLEFLRDKQPALAEVIKSSSQLKYLVFGFHANEFVEKTFTLPEGTIAFAETCRVTLRQGLS